MFNDVGAQILISRKFCVVCSAGQKDYTHVHKLTVIKALVEIIYLILIISIRKKYPKLEPGTHNKNRVHQQNMLKNIQ